MGGVWFGMAELGVEECAEVRELRVVRSAM